MKVITYFPKMLESREELAKRVAVVHAQAVVNYVKGLPLEPKEQVNFIGEIMR